MHIFNKAWLPFVRDWTPRNTFPNLSSDKKAFDHDPDKGYAIGTEELKPRIFKSSPFENLHVAPRAYESMQYGYGHGIHLKPFPEPNPNRLNKYTNEQIQHMDFSFNKKS
jgi:hypothetical protein